MLLRCAAAFKGRRFNFNIQRLMKDFYAVNVVALRGDHSNSVVELFRTETIEDACQFALGCFRSVNVSGVRVVVVALSDNSSIVTFDRK